MAKTFSGGITMIRVMTRKLLSPQSENAKGFALIEVLLSLTILAIAGTTIMRSFQNGVRITGEIRDMSKIVFLTEAKLHELELEYEKKHIQSVTLGELRGNFNNVPGAEGFVWRAFVELDPEFEAFLIRVQAIPADQAMQSGSRRNYRRNEMQGFWLKTIVPAARINTTLLFGEEPQMRDGARGGDRRGGRGSRGSRGGNRGGSRGGGSR